MEFSFHNLMLLFGLVVAGLSMVGAISVGPFGSRSVRVGLAMVSVAGFLACAFWSMSYLVQLDQRRAIEARFAELRTQALASGSALACLERAGEALQAACGETLFRTPETVAAANFYTGSRLEVLRAAERYWGPRTQSFDDSIAALRRSLERDPFGLTAHVLMVREGCTEERCNTLALLQDGGRVKENMRERAFDAHLARHAAAWRTGGPAVASAPPAPASTASVPVMPGLSPTGETRAPIPDKYTLPSAASIPPVSIMSDEPARPPSPPAQAKGETKGEAKERAAAERPATAAVPSPSSSSPEAEPQAPSPQQSAPAAAKQQPAPRRETLRPSTNAPLSITPGQ